jgi:hypothetical protein
MAVIGLFGVKILSAEIAMERREGGAEFLVASSIRQMSCKNL